MNKTKRLNELRAAQIRVHNLEIAVIVMGRYLEDLITDPRQADNVKNMLSTLFEANTAARGFSKAEMILPEVAPGGTES